jgi:hypothetical protein
MKRTYTTYYQQEYSQKSPNAKTLTEVWDKAQFLNIYIVADLSSEGITFCDLYVPFCNVLIILETAQLTMKATVAHKFTSNFPIGDMPIKQLSSSHEDIPTSSAISWTVSRSPCTTFFTWAIRGSDLEDKVQPDHSS